MTTPHRMHHKGSGQGNLALLVAMSVACAYAYADDNAWQGGSGLWNDPSNWSDGVPSSASDVRIDDGATGTISDVSLNVTTTINSLTIDAGDTLTQLNTFDLTLGGSGTRNDGEWLLDGTSSDTFVQFIGDQVLLGTGSLELGDSSVNRLITTGTLTNALGHTIRGGGRILANTGGLINEGSLIAEGTMQIDPNALGFTNNGTVRVTDGGRLELLAGVHTNNTSVEVASNGTLSIGTSAEVVGGELNTMGTGVVEMAGNGTLDGVTANAQIQQGNTVDVNVEGGLINNGTWSQNGVSSDTFTQFLGAQTLGGTGEWVIADASVNRLITNNTMLTQGADHTIRGGGRLLANTGGMINNGTIIAEGAMEIDPNGLGFTNNATLMVASGGSLELAAGVHTNNASIDVDNGGVLSLGASAELVGGVLNTSGTGTVELAGAATLDGVTSNARFQQGNSRDLNVENGFTNHGSWTMDGVASDTFVQFLGDQTLAGSGELIIADAGVNRLITNNATLTHGADHTIRGGGRLLANTGGMINNGTIIAEGAMQIDPNGLGFTNNAFVQVATGASLDLIAGLYVNNTSMDVMDAGVLALTTSARVEGGVLATSGSGIIDVVGNATLVGVTVNGTTNQSNSNDINLEGGLTNNGTWTMGGIASDTFMQFLGDQTLDGTGELVLGGASVNRIISNNATITHGEHHTIRGGGRLLANTGGLINNGTITADSATQAIEIDANSNGFVNAGSGVLRAEGDAGITVLSGGFETSGTVLIDGASRLVRTFGDYVQNGGLTNVDGLLDLGTAGAIVDLQGGRLAGHGSIQGSVVNLGGVISAGSDVGLSTGSLDIGGDYTQGGAGSLDVQLGGLVQGDEYDWISITGNAMLDGGLSVSLVDGFTAELGDTFDILSAVGVMGTFDASALLFPIFNGRTFDIEYLADTVRLTTVQAAVVPLPAGVWLLASGLAGLFATRRRQQRS